MDKIDGRDSSVCRVRDDGDRASGWKYLKEGWMGQIVRGGLGVRAPMDMIVRTGHRCCWSLSALRHLGYELAIL